MSAQRIRRIAALAIIGLTLSPCGFAGENLVTNGTFATGNFTDWTMTTIGNTNSAAVVIATDNTARPFPNGAFGEAIPNDTLNIGSPNTSSGYAAYFSTDYGTQILSQTIALGVGTYSIGYDVYVPYNGYINPYDASFSASIPGTDLIAQTTVGTIGMTEGIDRWLTVASVATIANAGNYTLEFAFSGAGYAAKDILVDRVFVVKGDALVPEPGSLILLVTAVCALGLMLVRRRRA